MTVSFLFPSPATGCNGSPAARNVTRNVTRVDSSPRDAERHPRGVEGRRPSDRPPPAPDRGKMGSMNKAFTRDDDQDETPFVPPRAPLPEGAPNYVTPRGLALLRDEMAGLEAE